MLGWALLVGLDESVGIVDGAKLGTKLLLGRLEGSNDGEGDGFIDSVGVTEGVKDGYTDVVGPCVGLSDGIWLLDGVDEGPSLGE